MALFLNIASLFLILICLLGLVFLFSGFETGMISINQLKLENEAKHNKTKAKLFRALQQPDKFLGTTLIGNNIFTIIIASLSTYLVNKRLSGYFDARYTSLIVGGVVLLFGEIAPKAFFRDNAETLVPATYGIIRFFYILFKPVVTVITYLNNKLQAVFKIENDRNLAYLTRDDLTFLLSQTENQAESEPHREMIEDALEFNEQKARNVMIPRTDIVALDEDMTVAEVLELAKLEGFTRYPVYHESLDNIVGVLILYDIIRKEVGMDVKAGELIHEPLFAPENMDLDILLKEMQVKHKSMAIIVDSFGGTAGIVTMEDIVEEIVGEIDDEFDVEEEREIEQIGPSTWLVQADVEIDRLNDECDIELPEGDYETVAGLILDKLERIPHQGQFVDIGDYRFHILQANDKKIIKVKLNIIHKEVVHETDGMRS